MNTFSAHILATRKHDRLHTWNLNIIPEIHTDISCHICHPPKTPTNLGEYIRFESFWTWFSVEYPALYYTSHTQDYFLALINNPNTPNTWTLIAHLLLSIRYFKEPKPYDQARQEIYTVLTLTNSFQDDPFDVVYNISETADSQTAEYQTAQSNSSDEEEDFGLELLFNQPQLQQLPLNQPQQGYMAQANQQNIQDLTNALTQLIAALPNTNNALTNNTNAINNPPRREARVIDLPYYYGGNQDPITWLTEFNKACNANGITDANKLQVAPAYLKGAAATWWTENQAL